jgi:hypothetical protein
VDANAHAANVATSLTAAAEIAAHATDKADTAAAPTAAANTANAAAETTLLQLLLRLPVPQERADPRPLGDLGVVACAAAARVEHRRVCAQEPPHSGFNCRLAGTQHYFGCSTFSALLQHCHAPLPLGEKVMSAVA